MNGGMNRRQFLKIAGLMGGASLFAGCSLFGDKATVPRYIQGAPGVDPVETLKGVQLRNTVCALCPGNCGIRCRVAEGTVVKIGGNPFHPVAVAEPLPFDMSVEESAQYGGSICAIGGSGIQTLYHPFRVVKPLKRVGPRGSNKWRSIEWKDALTEIVHGGNLFDEGRVAGLEQLRTDGTGFAMLVGNADWGATMFLKSFAATFPGATIHRDGRQRLEEKARAAAQGVFGDGTPIVQPDYSSARTVLSFGDAPLDSGKPIVSIGRTIAKARTSPVGFRWWVADPRLSVSASKADMWAPVMPGTDLHAAMGIMRALLDVMPEGATFANEKLTTAAKQSTLERYASACGLRPDMLTGAARMLAEGGSRSAVIPGNGVLGQPNGLEAAKAILTLNLLVGSGPGAPAIIARRDPYLERAEQDLLKGYGDTPRTEPDLKPAGALVLWSADPVYDNPGLAQSFFKDREALPLFVAIGNEITETSVYADYILPDTTYLERFDICRSAPAVPHHGIGVRSPAVGAFDRNTGRYAPIFPDIRPMEEILGEIGGRLQLNGFEPDRASGKWKTAWDFHEKALMTVLKAMADEGFPVKPTDSDLKRVMERGGIFAESRASRTRKGAATKPGGFTGPAAESVAVKATTGNDTFHLITYALPFHRDPQAGLNTWLLEILPKNRLLINTEDAKRLGIDQGASVVIEATDGSKSPACEAHVIPGIRPGTVALARGFGYTQSGASPWTIDQTLYRAPHWAGAGINPAGLKRVRVKRS